MSNDKHNKKPEQPQLMKLKDPLLVQIKKPKIKKAAIAVLVMQPGKPLGKYTMNWLSGRLMSEMLHQVYTSKEEPFRKARIHLRESGVGRSPREVHFQVLQALEEAYPGYVHRKDLADALELSPRRLGHALHFLRDFIPATLGISIIPDREGNWALANIERWIEFQRILVQQIVAIEKTRQQQGASVIPQAVGLIVRERFEAIQPELFALGEGEEDVHDHASD